ncbi:MAG: hypothetical protein H6Q36_90 [Chloroflexi bacterium]|nr:hypothetical protein [Chloroflexota bacterium]
MSIPAGPPSAPAVPVSEAPVRRWPPPAKGDLRRAAGRLRDPRRVAAIVILGIVFGLLITGGIARGELVGADARAYWAAVRIWLAGGDPFNPPAPFMPWVYAPWLLPLFAPWALLPWEVAWFAWRWAGILLFLWSVHWAYVRRPLATAVLVAIVALPVAASIDTGNINLLLVLMLWAAQWARPPAAGLLWALPTAVKWVPVVFLPLLAPRGRAWGLAFLGVGAVLSLVTLPAMLIQLETLAAFPRPLRIDYLIFLWALVPWLWVHPDPGSLVRPSAWRARLAAAGATARRWEAVMRSGPRAGTAQLLAAAGGRARAWLGIGG